MKIKESTFGKILLVFLIERQYYLVGNMVSQFIFIPQINWVMSVNIPN